MCIVVWSVVLQTVSRQPDRNSRGVLKYNYSTGLHTRPAYTGKFNVFVFFAPIHMSLFCNILAVIDDYILPTISGVKNHSLFCIIILLFRFVFLLLCLIAIIVIYNSIIFVRCGTFFGTFSKTILYDEKSKIFLLTFFYF